MTMVETASNLFLFLYLNVIALKKCIYIHNEGFLSLSLVFYCGEMKKINVRHAYCC